MNNLIEEFKAFKDDKQRWEWLINHKDQGVSLELDNDITMVICDESGEYACFDDYIGYSAGVFDLMAAIGINCESC